MTFPNLALTSPHKKGKQVADAQWLLSGHNRFNQKFYSGPLDSDWGPLCGAGAHRAKFWAGYPSGAVNNVFGDQLYSYLIPADHKGARALPLSFALRRKLRLAAAKKKAAQQTLGQKAVAVALTYKNYREVPENHTEFGKWYGMDGVAWCNIFVSYVLNKLGKSFKESYVPTTLALAQQSQQGLFLVSAPKEGDMVTFDWDKNGEPDHIGFFIKWIDEKAGIFQTVEGNTLPEGGQGDQSNGGGVYVRTRYTSSANIHFIRWY